jgi:hypothetical protein
VTSLGLWTLPLVAAAAGPPAAAGAAPGTGDGTAGTGGTAGSGELPAGDTGFGTGLTVGPDPVRELPATAADRGNGPDRTRTLVLSRNGDGVLNAALVRGGGTTLDALSSLYTARAVTGPPGAAGLRGDDEATTALRTTAAVIAGGTGVDPRAELRSLGIAYVVLQQSDTAAEVLAGRIDSVPGLAAVGNTDSGWLWRVVPPAGQGAAEDPQAQTARVRILAADGRAEALVPSGQVSADTRIPGGSEGRKLVLAERADTGWKATLDGRDLASEPDGWAQAFALPAGGGDLSIRYISPWQPWAEAGQAAVLLITVLLALPIPAGPRLLRVPDAGGTPTRRGGPEGNPGGPGSLPGEPGVRRAAGDTGGNLLQAPDAPAGTSLVEASSGKNDA